MRWNKPGHPSRIPTGRGFAVTSASRISAGGTAAAVVICVATGLLIGQSVLHGSMKTASSPTRPASVMRTSAQAAPARPRAPSGAALARAVRHLMSAEHGIAASREYRTLMTSSPVVHFTRVKLAKTWVFGTTAIPVPAGTAAAPVTAFFLAHVQGTGWAAALSGTPGFAQMLKLASGRVVTSAEATLLARFSAIEGATRPGAPAPPVAATPLALPWGNGQSWRLGTAAGNRASPGALASLVAFAGGDGRVRAAAPGRLYRFCGGRRGNALLEIIHADGSATQYGQLTGETTAVDGSLLARGAYLGMTGTTLACGGAVLHAGTAASGGAVAFAVLRGGGAVSLDGVALGGWILHEVGAPRVVSAQRAKTQVVAGGLMKNFGVAAKPAAAKTARAKTAGAKTAGAKTAGAKTATSARRGPAPPNPPAGNSAAALLTVPVADATLPSVVVRARAAARH